MSSEINEFKITYFPYYILCDYKIVDLPIKYGILLGGYYLIPIFKLISICTCVLGILLWIVTFINDLELLAHNEHKTKKYSVKTD